MAPAAGKFQGWICLTPISSRGIAFCLCQQHRQPPPPRPPLPLPAAPPQQHRHTRVPLHLLPPLPARRFTFCHRRGHPRPAGGAPPAPSPRAGHGGCDSPQRSPEALGAVPRPDPAQPRSATELSPTRPERPPSNPPHRPALRGPPHALSLPSSPRTPQHVPPPPPPRRPRGRAVRTWRDGDEGCGTLRATRRLRSQRRDAVRVPAPVRGSPACAAVPAPLRAVGIAARFVPRVYGRAAL